MRLPWLQATLRERGLYALLNDVTARMEASDATLSLLHRTLRLAAEPRWAGLKVSAVDGAGNDVEASATLDGEPLGTTPLGAALSAMAVSADGTRVLVGACDGALQLLSLQQERRSQRGACKECPRGTRQQVAISAVEVLRKQIG